MNDADKKISAVLIVDDVEINRMVASELLKPYAEIVDTAENGLDAIDAVIAKFTIANSRQYDIVFMDHFMPGIDGIETARRLRENGYVGKIFALTADSSEEKIALFKKNRFDGYLSKPIDVCKLEELLGCSNSYNSDSDADNSDNAVSLKLRQAFERDANKVITALRNGVKSSDLKSLTSSFHAIKSALCNIGENEKAQLAAKLEAAGAKGDKQYVLENVDTLIEDLERIIERFKRINAENPENTAANSNDDNICEDCAFIKSQLECVKSACEDYDIVAVEKSLGELSKQPLKSSTCEFLEKIRDMVCSNSEFDEALESVESFITNY